MANQSQTQLKDLEKNQIDQAQEQLEELQNQIKSRKALLEALGGESKFDEEKYLVLIKTLESTIQEKEESNVQQQQKINQLEQLLAEKDQGMLLIQNELQEIKSKNVETMNGLQQASDQIKTLNASLQTQQKENAEKEKSIKEQNEQIQSLQKKYNEAVDTKYKYSIENRRQSVDKTTSQTKIKSRASITQKSQYDIMLDKESDKGIISELQARIQELEKANFSFKEQTRQLKCFNQQLLKYDSLQKIKIEQYESSEEIASIKKLLDDKGVKIQQLEAKISELQSQVSNTERDDSKTNQIEQELKIVLELEQKKNEEFINQIEITKNKNSILEQEINMLREQIQSDSQNKSEEIEKKQSQITQLNEQLNELRGQSKDLQSSINLKDNQINQLEEKLKLVPVLTGEKNNLTKQLQDLKQSSSKITQEYEMKIENIVQNYENKVLTLQETVNKQKSQLVDERNSHRKKQEDFESQLNDREQEIQSLKQEVEMMDKIKQQSNSLIANYRKTIQETKEQIDQKMSELDETKFIKEQQDQDLEELREQINQKENKNERFKANLLKAQKQLQEYQKKIIPEFKKVQEEKDNEVRMVRDMLHSQQTLLRVKENDIIRLKQKVKKLETMLDEGGNLNDNRFNQNSSIFSNRKGDYNNGSLPPLNDENITSPQASIEQIRKQNLKNYQNRVLEQQRNLQFYGKNPLKHNSLPSSYANQNIFKFQQNQQLGVQSMKGQFNQNPTGNWIAFDDKTIQEGIEDVMNMQMKQHKQGFGLHDNQLTEEDQRWTPVSNNARAPSNSSYNYPNPQNNDSLLMKKKNHNSVFDLAATKDDIKNATPNPQFSLSPVRVKIPSMTKKGGNLKLIHPEEENQEQKTSKFEYSESGVQQDEKIPKKEQSQIQRYQQDEENAKQQSRPENESQSQIDDNQGDEKEEEINEEDQDEEQQNDNGNEDEEVDNDDNNDNNEDENKEEDDYQNDEEEEEENDKQDDNEDEDEDKE